MGLGSVTIAQINNNQGALKEVERTFLYMGSSSLKTNNNKILSITPKSDLNKLLGVNDSALKTQIKAAIVNSKNENFFAYAIPISTTLIASPIPPPDDWRAVLDKALSGPDDLQIEAVVLCFNAESKSDIEAIQTEMITAMTKYAKYLCAFIGIEGINTLSESWSDYSTKIKAFTENVVAERVSVVPLLCGNELGVLAGRLCNPDVTIADNPMRVATGALIGLEDLPHDNNSTILNIAVLEDLSKSRFSVIQWYTGYEGIYFGDAVMLDAEGGDFQVYENLRVLDYLARRVRILAIKKIGDRQLNSTPKSISSSKAYFLKPLRDAAKMIQIGAVEFPGIIKPPLDTDISITWETRTKVSIGITAAPYNCPKKITVYLGLDLNRYEEEA